MGLGQLSIRSRELSGLRLTASCLLGLVVEEPLGGTWVGWCGAQRVTRVSEQFLLSQWRFRFHVSAEPVSSCKSLRLQQSQLSPSLRPQIPEICSRDTETQASTSFSLPNVSSEMCVSLIGHTLRTADCCPMHHLLSSQGGDSCKAMNLLWEIHGLGGIGSQGAMGWSRPILPVNADSEFVCQGRGQHRIRWHPTANCPRIGSDKGPM